MPEYILMEDDCAPDAREYFIKDMKEKFGLNFNDFEIRGTKVCPDEMTIEWHYKDHVLSYSGDDPFYKLEERK